MSALGDTGMARATAWRFGYLLSQAGLSLGLFFALAQVLSTEAFTQAALAQAVLVMVQALGDFGLSQAAVVTLPARMARDPNSREEIMRGAAQAFLLAGGAAMLLTLLAVAVVPGPARLPTLLIGPAAVASVLVSGADGLLRSTGEFRRPVVLVTLSRTGAFLALPAAAISGSAGWSSAALSAGAAVMTLPAVRVLVNAVHGAARGSAADLLRAAVPLGGAQIFIVLAGRLNTIILSASLSLRGAAAFEGAWRLFQLGMYVAGALVTGAAPFIGQAVGGAEQARLRRMMVRLIVSLTFAGVAFSLALIWFGPWLSRLLLGELGEEVSHALLPFALLSPFAFVGYLASIALSASDRDRKWVLIAYGLGAPIGLFLVVLLSETHGLAGATAGCAIGWSIAQLAMIYRLALFMRRMDEVAP